VGTPVVGFTADSRIHVKGTDAVKVNGILLRLPVPLAFFGNHVQQYRFVHFLIFFKDINQMIQIVPVDGAEIFEG
jgi:hypothetical protein